MTAAIYAARAGKSVLLFEGNKLGGTVNRLKRIANYPGGVSEKGEELAAKMAEQTLGFGVKVVPEFVNKVTKTKDGFSVMTFEEAYSCRYVIYCGGLTRNKPEAELKFKGSGISYCAVCDGNFFKGKVTAVIGDGEAARRDVEYLLPICKKVYYVHTDGVSVTGAEDVEGKVGEFTGEATLSGIVVGGKRIEVDGAFIAMGGTTDGLIKGIETNNGAIVANGGRTNIEGFFVAGDCIYGSMKQIVSACYDGALAASLCK